MKDINDLEYKKFVDSSVSGTATRAVINIRSDYIVFDPTDNKPNYIGINESVSGATSESNWLITAIVYSGTSSEILNIKSKKGVWDNRASLF